MVGAVGDRLSANLASATLPGVDPWIRLYTTVHDMIEIVFLIVVAVYHLGP